MLVLFAGEMLRSVQVFTLCVVLIITCNPLIMSDASLARIFDLALVPDHMHNPIGMRCRKRYRSHTVRVYFSPVKKNYSHAITLVTIQCQATALSRNTVHVAPIGKRLLKRETYAEK